MRTRRAVFCEETRRSRELYGKWGSGAVGLDEGTNIDGGEEAGELDEGDDEVDGSEDDVKDLHARSFWRCDGRGTVGELEG